MKRFDFRITLAIIMQLISTQIMADNIEDDKYDFVIEEGYTSFYYRILSEKNKTVELADIKATYPYYPEHYYHKDAYHIPDSINGYKVVAIGDYAFRGNGGDYSIDSLFIPNTVTTLGIGFASPNQYVYIPNSVTEIPKLAFQGGGDYKISLPNTIVSIGDSAFMGYRNPFNLNDEFFIPKSVRHIGNYAFAGSRVYWYPDFPDSLLTIGDFAFAGSMIDTITIPKSVTYLGVGAFENCKHLKKVDIKSELITRIKKRTFAGTYGYSSLKIRTRIQLPSSIKVIEDSAFYGPGKRTILNFTLDSITSIGKFAFYGYECCYLPDTIHIPASLTHIGTGAFSGQESYINVDKDNPMYASHNGHLYSKDLSTLIYGWEYQLTAPYSWQYKNDSINISTIAPYAIASDTLSGGIASPYDHASYTAHIPQSVSQIEEHAFTNANLSSIYCYALIPPTCEENALKYEYRYLQRYSNGMVSHRTENTALYVPKGCKAIYEATEPWCNFKNIYEIEESTAINDAQENKFHVSGRNGIITINGMESPIAPIKIYNINGQQIYSGLDTTISHLPQGIYIIRVANKAFKIIL